MPVSRRSWVSIQLRTSPRGRRPVSIRAGVRRQSRLGEGLVEPLDAFATDDPFPGFVEHVGDAARPALDQAARQVAAGLAVVDIAARYLDFGRAVSDDDDVGAGQG